MELRVRPCSALLLFASLGLIACRPTQQPGKADAGACGAVGKACSGSSCCTGLSCVDSICACGAEGDKCGAQAACCSGLSCDGTDHCRAPCAQSVGACQPFGGACTGDTDCCASGTCHSGACEDPSTQLTCKSDGEACATAADCCGDTAVGSRLDCVTGSDGGQICHFGKSGEACDDGRHCTPGLTCIGAPDRASAERAASSGPRTHVPSTPRIAVPATRATRIHRKTKATTPAITALFLRASRSAAPRWSATGATAPIRWKASLARRIASRRRAIRASPRVSPSSTDRQGACRPAPTIPIAGARRRSTRRTTTPNC